MKMSVMGPRRGELEVRAGGSIRVTAVFVRTGVREALGHLRETILITDVRDVMTGELLADHLWFNRGEIWKKALLESGDLLRFHARAIEYRTGYWGSNKYRRAAEPPRREFKLTPPAELRVVRRRQIDFGEVA
jgi:hypothetical protein